MGNIMPNLQHISKKSNSKEETPPVALYGVLLITVNKPIKLTESVIEYFIFFDYLFLHNLKHTLSLLVFCF